MNKHPLNITQVLALMTLTVFALCLLLVLLSGAGVYRDLVERGELSHNRRAALHYLTTRVRQAQSAEPGTFHGCPALVLEDSLEGETFVTRIYCWDGWLWELYALPEAQLLPEDGQQLMETEHFSCGWEDGLLALEWEGERLLLNLSQEVGP